MTVLVYYVDEFGAIRGQGLADAYGLEIVALAERGRPLLVRDGAGWAEVLPGPVRYGRGGPASVCREVDLSPTGRRWPDGTAGWEVLGDVHPEWAGRAVAPPAVV